MDSSDRRPHARSASVSSMDVRVVHSSSGHSETRPFPRPPRGYETPAGWTGTPRIASGHAAHFVPDASCPIPVPLGEGSLSGTREPSGTPPLMCTPPRGTDHPMDSVGGSAPTPRHAAHRWQSIHERDRSSGLAERSPHRGANSIAPTPSCGSIPPLHITAGSSGHSPLLSRDACTSARFHCPGYHTPRTGL